MNNITLTENYRKANNILKGNNILITQQNVVSDVWPEFPISEKIPGQFERKIETIFEYIDFRNDPDKVYALSQKYPLLNIKGESWGNNPQHDYFRIFYDSTDKLKNEITRLINKYKYIPKEEFDITRMIDYVNSISDIKFNKIRFIQPKSFFSRGDNDL